MTAPGVVARSVSRWYGQVIAVNEISFTLEPGITALVGPNGAGKSTLLKMLTGEIRPTRGDLSVLGEDPWNNPALFRRVGYCPEQDALYDDMDAPSFVAYFLRLRGFEGGAARTRAEEALAAAGLDPAAWGRRTGGYSKGMRQRVRLAQAIAHRPEVLFLDEPLTGLDPMGRRELRRLFQRLAAEGAVVLVSSHVLPEVEAMTSRLLLLHRSRLVAYGPVHEIRELIDRHPHSVEVACARPRDLAARLVGLPEVEAVRLPREGLLVAETRAPGAFYPALLRILVEDGHDVRSVSSPDDNLEAVFRYLVTG